MIRIVTLLAGLALLTAGCSGLALQEGVGAEAEALPRQLQARQLIVTLAPATPEVWATLAKELSGEYGLDQVGAFPLTSLGVQCVVFQVSENRPLDDVLAQLTVDPRVESVQQNQFFQSLQALAGDPYASLQYGPRAVRADRAHAWVTGRGVRVAVVDTGVDTNHPDLTDRVVKTINFVEGGEKTFTADHHGTAVAGVIGARADNGTGIYGVAPDADLLAVKACWHRRTGSPEAWCSSWTLAKAIDFAIVERVRVLNLSLSGPPDPLLRRLIVKAIEEQSITVVAAVMERGDPALSFPSSLSTVIGVVASDAQGSVRARVGKQPAPLAAPGIEVLTTVPNGAYDFLSGSSFATAHVSGIVALLLEGNSQLSPREVRALLVDSGRLVNRSEAETVSIRHVDACEALRRVVRESCS
jgi:major intracellular serine protease